jgi:ABC-2 type transport system permease protein
MVGPFLRKLWIFGKLDLTLLLRDKSSLVWLLAVPLLFTWVFGQAFQGGGGPSDVKVALTVVDQDGGVLARRLIRALESSGFAVEEPALETAEPAVGDPAPESTPIRTLTIPAGFTETVLSGTTVDISLSTVENANPAGNQAAQINSYKAVIRLLSILAEMDAIPAEAADPASATGEPFAELAAEYDRLDARPPVVTVEVSRAGTAREVPSGYAQTVPGNLVMFVLMTVLIYGGVTMSQEKSTGLLARTAVTPISKAGIFVGKLGGRFVVGLAQVAVIVLAGTFIFSLYWGENLAALALVILAYTLCVASLGVLFGALVGSVEQASGIGVLATLIMASLGGCWWPMEIVPRPMQLVGHIFPTAWAMDALHKLISFGHGMEAVLPEVGVLLGFTLLFLALGSRFFKYS